MDIDKRNHNTLTQRGKTTDLWHVGIAHTEIAGFLGQVDAESVKVTWLPLPRSFAFIADPFAVREADGGITVYVEALDYRTKRGEIHYYTFDAMYALVAQGVALKRRFHLSYPFMLQHAGATYMLPEAHKSGALTLYRNAGAPDAWEPHAQLLDVPAIDASIVQHDGKWWMFFALPGEGGKALRQMHIAYADALTGPWRMHANNPVREDVATSRMGGTPFLHAGALYLPVQDCSHTYGGALRVLKVTTLTPETFKAEEVQHIRPGGWHCDFTDGFHTLSACGAVTLFDVKRHYHSPMRIFIDLQRRVRRLFNRW